VKNGEIVARKQNRKSLSGKLVLLGVSLLCAVSLAAGSEASPIPSPPTHDPHYTDAGFFDMHVCNWPERAMFFLVLFSTERFQEVKSIEVFRPDGRKLTNMDLTRYRLLKRKDKPEKHVFMQEIDLPADAADGWYRAQITLNNGQVYRAADYLVIYSMGIVSGMTPSQSTGEIAIPTEMKWSPVAGAPYYRVYITDKWDGKVIYESKLLKENRLSLPPGLIKPDGSYSWRVQARDVDGNILFGDFNHGSMSAEAAFTTAP
jgi:hypothetical protein